MTLKGHAEQFLKKVIAKPVHTKRLSVEFYSFKLAKPAFLIQKRFNTPLGLYRPYGNNNVGKHNPRTHTSWKYSLCLIPTSG